MTLGPPLRRCKRKEEENISGVIAVYTRGVTATFTIIIITGSLDKVICFRFFLFFFSSVQTREQVSVFPNLPDTARPRPPHYRGSFPTLAFISIYETTA